MGKIVGMKIEHSKPEETIDRLNMRLSEVLYAAMLARQDADSFAFNVKAERQKAKQLQDLIFRLKERKRQGLGPVLSKHGVPSRMDPMNTYDLEACEEELALMKVRIEKFQKLSDEYTQNATQAYEEAQLIQRAIQKEKARKPEIIMIDD